MPVVPTAAPAAAVVQAASGRDPAASPILSPTQPLTPASGISAASNCSLVSSGLPDGHSLPEGGIDCMWQGEQQCI